MIMMLELIDFLRILIILLSAETCIRYALWWGETRKMHDALLVQLMLGITMVHAALAGMMSYSLVEPFRTNPALIDMRMFALFSFMVLSGTFFHLIPCWRLSCGLTTKWVIGNLIIRVAGAGALTLGLLIAGQPLI